MSIDVMLFIMFIVSLIMIGFLGWVVYLIGYCIWYISDTIVKVNRRNS